MEMLCGSRGDVVEFQVDLPTCCSDLISDDVAQHGLGNTSESGVEARQFLAQLVLSVSERLRMASLLVASVARDGSRGLES